MAGAREAAASAGAPLLAALRRALPRDAPFALALRDASAPDVALARALLAADASLPPPPPPPSPPPPLLLAPPREAALLRTLHPAAPPHRIAVVEPDRAAPLRPYAAAALRARLRHVVVAVDPPQAAAAALSSVAAHPLCGDAPTGVEMLSPDVLSFHYPLVDAPAPAVQDAVSRLVPEHYRHLAHDPPFVPPELVPAALRLARDRHRSIAALTAQSDRLLRAAVLDTSHWGYVVARARPFFDSYNAGRAARLIAVHAMQRLCLHVSGSAKPPALDDAHVARLCHSVFSPTPTGHMRPLPKGRTAAGVVLRPATGRFAKRLRADADHMIMLTREPDHESAHLTSTRLRGNYTCAPLAPGRLEYWDNRFVIGAAPVSALQPHDHVPLLHPRRVFEAALQPAANHAQRITDCTLYVRQLRRADWDLITSVSSRARNFQTPFECIRALPAVFQKPAATCEPGELVASPHLGLSARPDLCFVAVRLPRFRCLPADLDPGFTLLQYEKWRAESHPTHPRHSKRSAQRVLT